jgi:U3 small nucleolar RNA-associated protein 20
LVGEEKEVVAILGKMKESKAKKGYDSFELVARNVSFQYITALLRPLRDLMEQSDSAKVRGL